jgi:replication-associated recombination protein RarA
MEAIIAKKFKPLHLMLYGTSGNGKTSIANIIARELTQDSGLWLKHSIQEFLAIEDLHDFLERNQRAYGASASDRCVIVFHELDKYKRDLSKLWTAMDEREDMLMVIFTTNNPTDFETPILSRCTKYEFTKIEPSVFAHRAQSILSQEGVSLSLNDVTQYLTKYTGHAADVRTYMQVIDQMLFLHSVGLLPALQKQPFKPVTLTIAK